MRPLLLAAALALPAFIPATAAAAPDEETLGKLKYAPCKDVLASLSSEQCIVWVMTHYADLYPSHAVKKAPAPRALRQGAQAAPVDVDAFLNANRNTGLLVLQGDIVLAERYQYQRTAEDHFVSMSMAKTLIGMLVGIALSEQKIKSIDDRAEQYIPELKGHPYGETPIRHLLNMSSGVKFDEIYGGDSDFMRMANATLFQKGPAGAAAVLPYTQRVAEPGKRWSYSSAETFILGLVLRGATGRSVSDYLSEKIWQPMGAESDATWNTDSAGNETGWCCFSATLRDWGRLGLLLADGGARDGRQIIPAEWVKAASSPQGIVSHYGYQTWVSKRPGVFYLRGLRGQAVDVHPASRTVVVHTAVYPLKTSREVQDNFFEAVLKGLGN
jgi:CubicO group peptidase (beta-lactamase class C family)